MNMIKFYVCLLQERIDGIVQACETFVQSGHFDADNIKSKADLVLERYTQLSVSCSDNIARMILFNLVQ